MKTSIQSKTALTLTCLLLAGVLPIDTSTSTSTQSYAASFAMPSIDLNQLKNDSKVVTDLFSKVMKEAAALFLTNKDLRMGIAAEGSEQDQYKGLNLYNAKTKEGFSILGGNSQQRRNIMLKYEYTAKSGNLYKTYASVTDGLMGKGYMEKTLKPLLKKAEALASGSTDAVVLGGSWDAYVVYGKTNEGKVYVSLAANSMVKSFTDQLVGAVKNTDVKFKAVSANHYEANLTDKTTKKPLGSIAINFKSGELTISSRGDAGADTFKKLANIGLKQIDPSGKLNYDSVFKAQSKLIAEYETISKRFNAKKSYSIDGQYGASYLLNNDKGVVNALADKYGLQNQLLEKNGNPALKVKVGVFDGWLYFKDGLIWFVVDFYPVA